MRRWEDFTPTPSLIAHCCLTISSDRIGLRASDRESRTRSQSRDASMHLCLFQPELTGGMIATSAPALITTSSGFSNSTYSRFTVSAQLVKILCFIPGYLFSSSSNSFAAVEGAGKFSELFLVYDEADAK